MTCIVGLEHEGKVIIGGDSAGVSGWLLQTRADEKVFVTGEFVFGFAGSFRIGQVLQYKFQPPPFIEGVNLPQYMTTVFVDGVRQCLKDAGAAHRLNERESQAAIFLVGVRGQLFFVESDYQVGRVVEGYVAVGCGDDLANGALFATRHITDADPVDRLTVALEAAARFSAAVAPPFNFAETPDRGDAP